MIRTDILTRFIPVGKTAHWQILNQRWMPRHEAGCKGHGEWSVPGWRTQLGFNASKVRNWDMNQGMDNFDWGFGCWKKPDIPWHTMNQWRSSLLIHGVLVVFKNVTMFTWHANAGNTCQPRSQSLTPKILLRSGNSSKMSDWTYEMLRYAFSWNDESSEKALKYVVTGRSPSESMSEFQSLVADSLWVVGQAFGTPTWRLMLTCY